MIQFLSGKVNSISDSKIINIIIYIASLLLLGFLLNYFYKLYIYDYYDSYYDPKIDILKNKLSSAIPEIRNIKISGSNKSFTINKKEIFLCLKDDNNEYYSDNMLVYVLLHEVAHVLCDEIGHTDKFKDIFRSLLRRAELDGLYDPLQPPVDDYCNY